MAGKALLWPLMVCDSDGEGEVGEFDLMFGVLFLPGVQQTLEESLLTKLILELSSFKTSTIVAHL